jgi:hypothetical protein
MSVKMNYEILEKRFLTLFLQVKGQKDYEFDPARIVMDICKIYVHLHESDAFCLAVSQDGRSYCPHLFTSAQDVLGKTYMLCHFKCVRCAQMVSFPTSVKMSQV